MSWYNEEAYAALRARDYSSFSGKYGYLMYGDYDPREHAAFYNRSRDPWENGSPFKGDGTFYMAAGSEQHHRALPRPFALLYSMLRLSNRCVRALCCARTRAHHAHASYLTATKSMGLLHGASSRARCVGLSPLACRRKETRE